MKRTGTFCGTGSLAAVLAVLSLALPVAADDTEIYFHPAPPDAPPPLVMLTLDSRPNLGATLCSNVNDASCRDDHFCGPVTSDPGCEIGQGIYDALYPGAPQTADKIYVPDGIATDGSVASGAVSQLQAFVAAFRYIFFTRGIFDGMRVGLMMNHDDCLTGSCGGKSNGGYVLRGFELLEKGTDTNGAKQELLDIFGAQPTDLTGSETHPYQGRELFFELYRYMAGLDVLNGEKGYADFGSKLKDGTPNRNLDYEFSQGFGLPPATKCAFTLDPAKTGDNRLCLDYIDPTTTLGYTPAAGSNLGKAGKRISSAMTWDPGIINSGGAKDRYISPYSDGEKWECSGAYSINMLFQVSNQDNDSDVDLAKALADQGLEVPKPTGGEDGFSQVIAKLNQMDIAGGQATGVPSPAGRQSLTSFFLISKKDIENNDKQGTVKTNKYAAAGGTGNAIPALGNPASLVIALDDIANKIKSVSSTFVAVTVPVNADNRVTSLPNMFVALFQVDEKGKPYWPGNVKKLDVVVTSDEVTGAKQLDVLDANGKPAFNTVTGRIDDYALTVWTDPNAADVQTENLDSTKGPILVKGRDGSAVRRGGAGHKIPGYRSGSVGVKNSEDGARQIFLDPETVSGTALAGNAMVPLDADSAPGALRENEDVQTRFGFRDTSDACPEKDSSTTYCLTAIKAVLDFANIGYSGDTAETMARNATQALLRWIRGFDVFNEKGASGTPDGLTTTAQRKWMMGDVLHSRPVAVNYGSRSGYGTDNQDVRLIFGANDGLLRMVRNTAAGTSKPDDVPTQQGDAYGQEVWAFLPRELLAHVPQLAMDVGDAGLNRPYGADGPPTLFTIDTNGDGTITNNGSCAEGADDCDRAWIYFGLRRGGKSYYAVDVSYPDATTPKLLWKIDKSMADFTELGMTFSPPRVGWVRFEDVSGLNQFGSPATNVPVPVVIFGGGYNGHAVAGGDHHQSGTGGPSKDTILGTPFIDADTQGNAIYIVQARTGRLIWKATSTGTASATHYVNAMMQHGIAAPVSPMDSDGDGILDRLYVADTGGRVWRVDLPEFVPGGTPAVTRATDWKATVLANLRPADLSTPSSRVNDLRFFHGATIVRRARDSIGVYDALYLGSGDREHPQSDTYDVTSGGTTTTVTKINWFFLLKDRLTTSGDPAVGSRTAVVPSDLLDVTDKCFSGSGTTCVSDTTSTSNNLQNGWRLKLEGLGEKNLSEPFIGGEGVIFTTFLPRGTTPDDEPCLPLGASRLYQVALDDGAPLRFLHDVVGDTFSKLDRWVNLYAGIDGGVVAVSPDFWITATGKSGSNPPQKPVRFYWRESGVDAVK